MSDMKKGTQTAAQLPPAFDVLRDEAPRLVSCRHGVKASEG